MLSIETRDDNALIAIYEGELIAFIHGGATMQDRFNWAIEVLQTVIKMEG